jgi:mono/diheme cytochrome c family protein
MTAYRRFTSQQISDLLAHLRSWHPLRNHRDTVARLVDQADTNDAVSIEIGRTLFTANCVTCHGAEGRGDLALSLNTPEFLTVASNDYLYETIAAGRPGTGMPAWRHLSNDDVASLILLMRSWQQGESRTLPIDTIAGDWDAGRLLYAGLCASCHGSDAEGGVGPQLANPVFLRSASDAMIREWIAHGKAGTPMRAFLKGEQGAAEIQPGQIDNLVAYLRSLERQPRVGIMRSPNGRPERGRVWYAQLCAACHGADGEGASGPALANAGFLGTASDGFLLATLAMGRDGTEMRPVKDGPQSILALTSDQVNDVVAFLRSWETSPPTKTIPHRYVIPWDFEHGRQLYEANCAGCHGVNGKPEIAAAEVSAWAPELNNEGFLAAATDGFLTATIVRGRSGTAMRPFGHGTQGLVDLSMQDIDDIVAYIRQWSTLHPSPLTIPAQRSRETSTTRTREETDTHTEPRVAARSGSSQEGDE